MAPWEEKPGRQPPHYLSSTSPTPYSSPILWKTLKVPILFKQVQFFNFVWMY